jgi:hypothetical protein
MLFWPPLLPVDKPTSIKHRGRYKYIDYYINLLNLPKPFNSGLKNEWARPPTTWAAWYHQIHAAEGASGSITMVVVFVGYLCCCGWTRDVTRPSYVKNGTKITLRRGYVG